MIRALLATTGSESLTLLDNNLERSLSYYISLGKSLLERKSINTKYRTSMVDAHQRPPVSRLEWSCLPANNEQQQDIIIFFFFSRHNDVDYSDEALTIENGGVEYIS
jgi:hypothetical protein